MYQTHPFREEVTAGDPKYLHGAESFNGHYHHINNNELAEKFCEENNLIKMAGTDFHHDDQPITTAMFIPSSINNEKELANFLMTGKAERLEDRKGYLDALKKHKLKYGIIIE